MKTYISLLFATLLCAGEAHAQFYTVEARPLRCHVRTQKSLPGNREAVHEEPVAAAGYKERAAEEREVWVNRYLSVSFPLKEIKVTSPFGKRANPFTGKGKETHRGLDLRAATGTEVYAVMDGEVVKVGSDKRSGNYITLRHGIWTVSYCHLSQALVPNGQTVRAGMVVGQTGRTGRSTGSHLHITLKKGRTVCDPLILLDYIKSVQAEAIEKLLGPK